MKNSLFVFALLFSACTQPNFTLDMTIADGHDFDGHQLDSVRIAGNRATFRTKMPYPEMLCEVIIEDCPTSFQQFRFARGERASFVFDPDMQTLYPEVDGSDASEEVAGYWSGLRAAMREQRELRMALANAEPGSDRAEEIGRKSEQVSADIRSRSIDLLLGTKSLINAFLA